jgi:hypothetical protein
MLNVSTVGNMADVYVIVHLVPHTCQHITVNHVCYYSLLTANQGNYMHKLFFKKTWRVPLSINITITMFCCVVYLLQIFLNVSQTYE